WWGLFLAQVSLGGGLPNLWFAFLFWVGAIVMRGAGCTLNDIVDRNYDGRVVRTKGRPIPSGRVSVKQALVFLVVQCLLGLAVLLQFNFHTVLLASASLLIVAIYPFMKRITNWPQLVLGLAFNWGALVGWSATQGSLSWPPVVIYLGGVFWTLAYDTIYAHQDREDDVLIGVKSTALHFGENTKGWLGGFFALALISIDSALWLAGVSFIAHMGVVFAALHAGWQIKRLETNNSALCLRLFKSNRDFGLIIATFLFLDCLIP
ncbi:MAG: 4-hydroxybenzoate octaprenyltransferase, partial [Aestuariivirga sp.]|nr:4-hydroxybenzoate octaprenyltransferase [Aestuariivirga sp.]